MKTYILFIVFSILLGCSGLGDVLSLQLVEKRAIDNNRYCYVKDTGHEFCMTFRGFADD